MSDDVGKREGLDSGHHPFSGMKAAGVKVAWHVRVTEKKKKGEWRPNLMGGRSQMRSKGAD